VLPAGCEDGGKVVLPDLASGKTQTDIPIGFQCGEFKWDF
jgi:hypothetical protein